MKNSYAAGMLIAIIATAGCKGDAPGAKPAPPASVANPVQEAQLATVKLTEEAERRLAIAVETATIESVLRTRTAGGEVIAPPGRVVVVTAPIPGTVRAAGTGVRAGAHVSSGQTIFTIFPLQAAEQSVRIDAERELATAAAELRSAQERLTRLEQLLKDGATSARSVEEARAQRDVAAAAVNAAKARAGALRQGPVGPSGEVAVRAPISGVLQEVAAAPGQTIAAAAPLFTVAQADAVWVRVSLYVGERAEIDPSQPAAVTSLGSTGGAAIVATRVDGPPSANPTAATTDLFYAPSSATATLRLGERVSVELPLRQSQKALVVPQASLLYDLQGGTWVYEALGNHVFVRRRIEVGGQVGTKVIVARGLDAGKNVVTAGAAELFGTEFGAGK